MIQKERFADFAKGQQADGSVKRPRCKARKS
jgi:hypothetical protein